MQLTSSVRNLGYILDPVVSLSIWSLSSVSPTPSNPPINSSAAITTLVDDLVCTWII